MELGLQAFGEAQEQGIRVHIKEAGVVVEHATRLDRRREAGNITRLDGFQVMPTNMDVAFNFIQSQAEEFAALMEIRADGEVDIPGGNCGQSHISNRFRFQERFTDGNCLFWNCILVQ